MPTAAAHFSDSQSRLFRCLFGQPGYRYHPSGLRRLRVLARALLQPELNRLAAPKPIHSSSASWRKVDARTLPASIAFPGDR
jgi:hypothetical protein